MRSTVAGFLALLMCASASAFPQLWAGISDDCNTVPASGYGPHSPPTPDEQTVLVVKKLGSVVWKMCPGMAHKIQAKFPEQRQYLITASQGSFSGTNAADKCLNRFVSPGAMPAAEVELNLPCDTTGFVKLDMVSVASPGSKEYKQVSTTLPVNPLVSCPASPCHALAAAAQGKTNLESGSLTAPNTDSAMNVQLPAIPSTTVGASNPSAPATDAAASAPPNTINIDLGQLLKLPQLQAQLNQALGGSSDSATAGAAAPATPAVTPADAAAALHQAAAVKLDPAAIVAALQKLQGAAAAAAAPTDPATAAAAAPAVAGIHPLQALSNINATQAWLVIKQLGKMLNNQEEQKVDLPQMLQFVQQVGKLIPGAAAGGADAAPDVPTAVMNVVKATGKLLPSDKPADLVSVINFCKSVGDLLGKLAALRPPQPTA